MEVIVYSADWCPKCQVLKKKLASKFIEHKTIKDEDIMDELGIDELPMMSVDGGPLMNFSEARNWVDSYGG